MKKPLLRVKNLDAFYGASQVLFDLNFDLYPGEILCLAGRNGVGKSSTLKALLSMGLKKKGSIHFLDKDITHATSSQIARLGLAYCPDDRGIFSSLSTKENLCLAPVVDPSRAMSLEEIFELFPQLKDRLGQAGNLLSGGEQQMLAIARILRVGARILLLDEPSEGLAPIVVKEIENVLKTLKEKSFTILLVEQNRDFLTRTADRYLLMDQGKIVDTFDRSSLEKNKKRFDEVLALGSAVIKEGKG